MLELHVPTAIHHDHHHSDEHSMTEPTDPRRPPSEELSWELLAEYENGLRNYCLPSENEVDLLCRTIRSLCAERESLLEQAVQRAEVNADLVAQLSAYVTAAEGRPASELIAPSEVERIIGERAELTAQNMGLHQLIDEQARGGDTLESEHAQQKALLAKQAAELIEAKSQRDWHQEVRAANDDKLNAEIARLKRVIGGLTTACPYVECEWYDGGKRDPRTHDVICEGCRKRYAAFYDYEVGE